MSHTVCSCLLQVGQHAEPSAKRPSHSGRTHPAGRLLFSRSIYPEGTMSDTQQQWDRSKTNGDFRKRGLRLERTSLQEGGITCKKTKPNPIRVCEAATTRCFIDPSCQCAPVPPVCLLTHVLSFGERNNIEEVSSGAEIIFTSSKQQTNIYSRSPLSKPPPRCRLLISFHCMQACGVWSSPLLL